MASNGVSRSKEFLLRRIDARMSKVEVAIKIFKLLHADAPSFKRTPTMRCKHGNILPLAGSVTDATVPAHRDTRLCNPHGSRRDTKDRSSGNRPTTESRNSATVADRHTADRSNRGLADNQARRRPAVPHKSVVRWDRCRTHRARHRVPGPDTQHNRPACKEGPAKR